VTSNIEMIPTSDIFKVLNFFSEPKLREEIVQYCQLLDFGKGEILVREGQYIKVVPIVLSGTVRVFQTREDREILLYYVEQAQTCIMSLSAFLYDNKSPAQAVTVTKAQVLAIPTNYIAQWQREFASWNEFVIRAFRNRYDELLNNFKSVAFDHTNTRVLEYLKNRTSKQQTNKLEISHRELANEVGTTRVVISRILKQFQAENKVSLKRGSIQLL
jgi:CRP/FNR family transcriptional regulator